MISLSTSDMYFGKLEVGTGPDTAIRLNNNTYATGLYSLYHCASQENPVWEYVGVFYIIAAN